jgi:hypothetical protein
MINEILYINPSHQHENKGVMGYGIEADNAYVIAKRVYLLLKESGLFKAVYLGEFSLTLPDAIAEANRLGATLVLDIHTDAGGGRGCTGIYKSVKGKAFIQKVYDRVSALTPSDDRGVVQRTNLGILNQTDGTAGLIELMFHDSPEDVTFFLSHKEEFAVAVARGICDYFNVELPYAGIGAVVPATPVVKPVVSNSHVDFVKALQKECNVQGVKDINGNSIKVDGIAGNHTLEALGKIILKEGKSGNFVKLLQGRLGGIKADGKFGALTKAKVVEIQKIFKLSPDGIVGYNTWYWLTR